MTRSHVLLGFRAFLLNFFKIQRRFVVCRTKIHSDVVFFEEKWSFSLQDPIFHVFSDF